MKKHIITLFLLLASEITLQAAITYELNGGITNDYGWMSKSDMFTACLMDALEYDLGISLSEFKQSNSPYDDLFVFFEISHCQKILDNAKWDWLEEYLISEQEGELFAAQLTAGTASKDWRYAIAAFFFESQYDTSSDYSQAGKDEAYIPAWKHAYDNPTSPKKEWTLNAPYKEGATFEGWYTTANFSGEQVTTVNASTSGTLYAKWQEEEVTEYKVVEDDITNLVINPDAMTLIGGPSTNFEVEVYLILSENYNSNGQRLLSDQSTVMILGMDAIFLDGYAYDIDVATTSAKAVLHVDLNSELYELQLNMNASSQEAFEIVIENAVVDTSRLDNGVECFLQMTAEWTNPRDGLTYPIVVEVPSYNPQATDPYEVLCTVTTGGYGNDVPWFGVAEGYLTITTIGKVVTVTGMIANEWLNFAANVTISGQLPASENPPCDNVYTEFTATFCNEYNWNNIIYTVSGDYTQTFTTANGCDSIVTLHLIEDCPVIIDPTHQILYTSTDGNIITPYNSTVFGANIISNTYENGQGVMTFDAPVTSIGDLAFEYCSFLSSIIIPNSVTSIGSSAFYYCSSLTSITIPKSVSSIGVEAFTGCTSLTSMVVESDNHTYDSRNNCNAIIETATNTLVNGCKNTIIPNTVVSIGLSAFNDCSTLTSIIIPSGVKNIGRYAFAYCSSLASITFPNSVKSIESGAFYNCSSLSSVNCEAIVPPTLGDDTFWKHPEATPLYIPCASLESYQQSDWAAYFSNIVENCENASRTEEAICNGDEYLWDIDNNWYNESGTYYAYDEEGKHVLELTVYPPTEDEEEYATIAFGETYWWNDMEYDEAGTYTEILYDENGCEYTATLYLTVMEDDSCPVYMCNNREFLSVDDCAWYALDLAELSGGEDLRIVITNEWGGEFVGCEMTFYVERSETAASVFELYKELNEGEVIDTIMPRSLFEQYEKLYLQISVDASLNILFTYYMPCTQENSMPYTWGTEVSTDGEDAGTYHIDLEQLRAQNQSVELTITNSSDENGYLWMVDYRGNCSYNQCLDDFNSSLDIFAIAAKSTTKWIIDLAQKNETSTDHYFAATMFGENGFFDETILSGNWVMNPVESRTTLCQNAESIKSGWIYQLQANEQRYFQLDSADIYTIDTLRYISLTLENLSDTPIECTYSTGICGMEQVMPTITLSAYESKIVPIQLSSYFALFEYKGDYNLGIHTTGDALVQCTIDGIESEIQHQLRYTSSDGNLITPYNTNAFGANIVYNIYTNGQGIMLFDAPVTSIGNAAFYSCSTLSSIQIPNTVLAIRMDAFTGCNQLSELTIPASVMSIDRNFISTQYLTAITVDPENQTYDSRNNCNAIIETASNRLLKGCQNTIIPNTVQIIGNSAFANCTALTQIVIPDGVSTIEYGAFNGCNAVETIRSLATIPPTLESNAFGSISPTMPVYVPCSSLEMYQAEEHWGSTFSNIQCSSVTICYGESYTWHINGKTYTESGTYTHTTNYGEETLYLTVLPEVPVTEIIERICYGTTYQIGGEEYATTGNYTITLQDQNGCDSIINLQLTVLSDVITEEKSEVISSNDIPYYWRGNAYSTTGRYTEVEQYAGTDCDSVIYILDLLVLTTGNYEEQYDTICQSQLPYIWYEQEIHSAGKYSYTEQYVGSAIDSIQHILNLTVIATDYSDEYQTICYGETYTWNGQTYNTPGSYTATLSNIRGCDSIATLHLTVLPEIPTTEEYATICYGETFMWNGITCKYTDTYSAVLASVVTGCDSTAILHLTVLPQSTTETQKVNISVNELPYYWREKWYNESGDYYDTVSYSQYACDSAIYVLTLTVNTTNMCGDNLIWEYANGVLNIKGSGAMYDNPDLLSYRQQPWYPEGVNHIVLPDGITHIGDVAFADCANLTSISLPSSLTSLGDGAFSWTGLQSVTIPAGVTTMGEQVFETCNDLRTILYEGNPTTINNQTVHPFIGCTHLDTIITPAALWHCTSANQALEARYGVPHKARYIEVTDGELTKQAMSYIAQNSSALEVLDLTAATNTTLPLGALMNSNRLSYLYLPEQIQTVPEMLAEGCYSLMEIIIPATVTEIGNYAFAGCTNVWRMTVDAVVPPTVYAETFKGIDRNISVIVPAGSEEAYRQAAYWQEFFIKDTNSPLPITNCQKILREDHILILRNGQTYTMMGQPVNIGL